MKNHLKYIVLYARGMATMLLIASLALNIYMVRVLKADPLSYKTASIDRLTALIEE